MGLPCDSHGHNVAVEVLFEIRRQDAKVEPIEQQPRKCMQWRPDYMVLMTSKVQQQRNAVTHRISATANPEIDVTTVQTYKQGHTTLHSFNDKQCTPTLARNVHRIDATAVDGVREQPVDVLPPHVAARVGCLATHARHYLRRHAQVSARELVELAPPLRNVRAPSSPRSTQQHPCQQQERRSTWPRYHASKNLP